MYIYKYIYIHIYTHVYIYTCIYIHMHIHAHLSVCRRSTASTRLRTARALPLAATVGGTAFCSADRHSPAAGEV